MTARGSRRELSFLLSCALASFAAFSLARIVFLLAYRTAFTPAPACEIVKGFLHGARFDASAIAMLLAGVLVASHLPVVNRLRAFRVLWICAGIAAVLLSVLLLAADLIYFGFARKHLGYEAVVYLDRSMLPIVATGAGEHPMLFAGGLAALAAAAVALARRARSLGLVTPGPVPLKARLLGLLVAAPVTVIAVRGGLQEVPIRVGDALVSRYEFVNHLTMNGPFSVLDALGKGRQPRLMPAAEARRIGMELLGLRKGGMIDPAYPLYRPVADAGGPVRPNNVILILLENWTAKFDERHGGTLGVTPRYDALSRDGLVFTRFFATGYRTTAGIFSTLNAFPEQVVKPVMRLPEISDNFGSASALVRSAGYATVFVHSGPLSFDNLGNMLRHEGFDVILGKGQMAADGVRSGLWGFPDEAIYRRALGEFRKVADRPFFGLLLTVSGHPPYAVPDGWRGFPGGRDLPDARYLDALSYADDALGRFFDEARRESWFPRTIFVITSDHTHHENLNLYENQNIPLLIYAPGIIAPGTSPAIGGQPDIVPTIAALLNLPAHASLGRDLGSLTADEGFAFFVGGDSIGWIQGDHLALMGSSGGALSVYNCRTGDYGTDLAAGNPALTGELRRRLSGYHQFATDLLMENRIIPPAAVGH